MANPKGNPQTLVPFQSKWKSGPTRTIRVPIALAEQVLGIARLIDEGLFLPPALFVGQKVDQLVQELSKDPEVTRNGRDAGAVKRALNAFIARLKECSSTP